MEKEDIKGMLALTEVQRDLLRKLNDTLTELRENHVGIIFDSCIDSLSFAAFNEEHVLEINNIEALSDSGEAVNVEDCIEWGNVLAEIHEYDHYYSDLYAVIGCKTDANASMMSAAL